MAIFSVPIRRVRNTRIYVSPTHTQRNRQLTLFSNEVDVVFDDAYMILPVPHPQTVRIHRLTYDPMVPGLSYLDFLDRVESAFDEWGVEPANPRFVRPIPRPHRQRIGRYNVTILNDIDELREFTGDPGEEGPILHEQTLDELEEMYPRNLWGFIVCKLMEGHFLYEPLCYSHQLLGDQLYIPSLLYNPRNFQDFHIPEESSQFDDKYFINGTSGRGSYHLQEVNPARIQTIPWRLLPQDYNRHIRYLLCKTKRGLNRNCDLFLPISEYNSAYYEPWLDRRHEIHTSPLPSRHSLW